MGTDGFYGGGGWFRSVGTGSILRGTAVAAAVLASALLIGTGGVASAGYYATRHEHGYRFEHPRSGALRNGELSASDRLELVRRLFKPSVTELARVFGVSRQAVYNWINGAVPSRAATELLESLTDAANVLSEAGVAHDPYLLRRKIHGGMTLMNAVKAGASGALMARILIEQLDAELRQRDLVQRRLAGRRPPAQVYEEAGAPRTTESS